MSISGRQTQIADLRIAAGPWLSIITVTRLLIGVTFLQHRAENLGDSND
jgi:hypothetical protein